MVEPSIENPNSMESSSSSSSSPPEIILPSSSTENPKPIFSTSTFPRPAVRFSTEFDNENPLLFNKISCKLFDCLAKFKFSFLTDKNGTLSEPQLGLVTKYLSLHYDFEENNASVKSSFDVGKNLQFRASQDVMAQQGEVAVVASLPNPAYKLELSSTVPVIGLPKTTFKFPLGEVSVEERQREEEEVKRVLSVSGIVKGQLLNGICTAEYKDEDLNLRYSYKDEEMTIIPRISLPSNVMSLAFKRRFGPSNKLSYLHNFDSDYWSAVYKHAAGKHLKFKAGYDSEERLGWASLWFGDEGGTAKTAPNKMKAQLMLQVHQDNIKSPVFLFRVKKRWDL